ncbi:MAG: Rieske (2Fe-2S) protein [Gammaproteobacteria bacterium]
MRPLCSLSELAGVMARGFELPLPDCAHGIVVVRGDGVYHGYLNRCPHRGLPFNWLPDQFLDPEGRRLQCANHGALFNVADGYCVAGPCAGARLVPVSVIMRGTELWLDDSAAAG